MRFTVPAPLVSTVENTADGGLVLVAVADTAGPDTVTGKEWLRRWLWHMGRYGGW